MTEGVFVLHSLTFWLLVMDGLDGYNLSKRLLVLGPGGSSESS
jgi:hypothetical protein